MMEAIPQSFDGLLAHLATGHIKCCTIHRDGRLLTLSVQPADGQYWHDHKRKRVYDHLAFGESIPNCEQISGLARVVYGLAVTAAERLDKIGPPTPKMNEYKMMDDE